MPATGVSIVVPFRGDLVGAERLGSLLERLELRPGDEIVVADNTDDGVYPRSAVGRVVRATGERSSYHARNVGAAVAGGDWILFMDADCVPAPGLIGAYLADEPEPRVGALAGSVLSDPAQNHFLARYAADRGFLDQQAGVHTADDGAATANLMVRRTALEAIGGFTEGIRSGGDVDLCRRLVGTGWSIERRPGAVVQHLHRESLPDLLATIARYASGASWLNERYPGTAPAWPLVPGLVSCARDVAASAAHRRWEQAAFRGVDALGMVAHTVGYNRSNTPT